jgi:alkanesulfonate monooxygenase SsuD/methylene tetrahydromethanopterin reductase-like flavin-dependent oxidoreductase (luciferase family)
MIPKMWTQDSFEHSGRFWTIPPRNVIPKPVQKPHPPLWVSGVSPQTFEIAADKGIGVLSFSLSAPGQSEKAVAMYKERIKSARPAGAFVNNNVAAFTVTLCLEDDAEAKAIGGFAAGAYAMGAQQLYGKWAKEDGAWRACMGASTSPKSRPRPPRSTGWSTEAVVCIGDPDRCIKVIKHWEEIGVDQIMCLMQAGRVPHDKVMESIRLFGEHIIPYFKKRSSDKPQAAATTRR